ncbi:MAG: undecaprenyl/decaprenyl-phosphate alpha-N-acetylglucosaminyl 1-phosphate transferase [Coriobacteriaceae bacterium]|nr:undecaprenyl/decaprenyl-phosphate alpha-N-acetylglucosaminyl 1-phosphate transferase [Coriobacteriaceae bacterium]
MLNWWHYLSVFLVALIVTVLLVPVVKRVAIHFNIMDYPGTRRINTKPIPRLGGVAIFIGILAGLALEWLGENLGWWIGPFFDIVTLAPNVKLIGVVCGLAFIVIVGVVDDVRSLPPWAKVVGQVISACIIAFTGTLLGTFKVPFTNMVVDLGYWAYPITIIYLVAFANIINLIDGLDGLAAGITGIAAISLFCLTFGLGRNEAALAAIILVGACIGFLFYNFHPASIFMGDSGSLLLGIMLGTISLLGATRFASVTALAVPLIIAGVPLLDTFGAIIRRIRGHQPIQVADAGHIHHRLLRRGFSQRKAVSIIYAWTAFLCIGAVVMWNMSGLIKYIFLVVMLVVSAIIAHALGLLGPVLTHHYYPEGDRQGTDEGTEEVPTADDAGELPASEGASADTDDDE